MEEFKALPTIELQKFSLQQFMSGLGYTLYRTNKGGYVFVSNGDEASTYFNKDKMLINYNSAVRLHNAEWNVLPDGVAYTESAGFLFKSDAYFLMQALAKKVVEKVKLQYSKKRKQIILLNPLVKFEYPAYESMFLIEIEEQE